MTTEELIALVKMYDEWQMEEMDVSHPVFVSCPLCNGGGTFDGRRKSSPPRHKDDCPRKKFEEEHGK